jgi:hypothetical protein
VRSIADAMARHFISVSFFRAFSPYAILVMDTQGNAQGRWRINCGEAA